MLNENMKRIKKSKGFSQDELATNLNVVRQTVSKWERGLSAPDSEMLISLSKLLETPVSILLGETIDEPKSDELKVLSEKLERINLQLARRYEQKRNTVHYVLILFLSLIILTFSPRYSSFLSPLSSLTLCFVSQNNYNLIAKNLQCRNFYCNAI